MASSKAAGRSVMTNGMFQLLAAALISMMLFGLLHMAPYSQHANQIWASGSRVSSEASQAFARPLLRRQLAAFDWARQEPQEQPKGTLVVYTFSNTDSGVARPGTSA